VKTTQAMTSQITKLPTQETVPPTERNKYTNAITTKIIGK